MPSPSTSLSTLRPDLSSSLEEFDLQASRLDFIGIRAFPVIEVARQTGSFGKIPIEQLLQSPDTERAPGSGYNRGSFTFTTATYACDEHGHEEPVDDREARIYRDYFDAEVVATQRARDAILRNHERRVAAALFNATTFTSQTTSITNEWDSNHTSDATPIANVETAVQAVYNRTGLWPNALILNRLVFRNLRLLDEITDAIQAAGAGAAAKASDITPQMLASVFDLDYVLVAGSAYNSAKEGQSASVSSIWSSEYAMVARIATTNDPKEPCIGRTFHWGEDGSEIGGVVESYRDESVRSDIIRCRMDTDELVLYTEAAQLLDNVTTI